MPRRELRLGLVGCGRLAERGYVPAVRRAAGVRLVAVADPELSRCARSAPDVPAHDSAAALLAAGGVDALVLATPAATHVEDARLAARAGLPTLIEKPPATDASGAAQLAALQPPPWVGFNRRFYPALQRLRVRLPEHETLELELAFACRAHAWGAYVVADDALLDLGPHLVDLTRWLSASEVSRVRAISLDPEHASLELELERGSARISIARDRPYRERLTAKNAAGDVLGEHSAGGPTAALAALLRRRAAHPLVSSLTRQLEAFARAARGVVEADLASAADGVAVMTALDAARSSAGAGSAWQAVANSAR